MTGSVSFADVADFGFCVEIFVAFRFISRNPPSGAIFREVELGKFIANDKVLEILLLWPLVPKANAVVEHPEKQPLFLARAGPAAAV